MRMELHRHKLNSVVANEIELGMMISTIIYQTSVGIKVTKGIELNVLVPTTIISL
jgi:hypothetical protein